jgi:hypothetical protein
LSKQFGDRSSTSATSPDRAASAPGVPGKRTLTEALQYRTAGEAPMQVQCKDGGGQAGAQEIAATGLTGAAQSLPHGDRIQSLFGRHSIAGIQAHVGGPAAEASRSLGAQAYATGSSVAFASAPDQRGGRRRPNRWANRRIVLTFNHPPAAGPAAPAPPGP